VRSEQLPFSIGLGRTWGPERSLSAAIYQCERREHFRHPSSQYEWRRRADGLPTQPQGSAIGKSQHELRRRVCIDSIDVRIRTAAIDDQCRLRRLDRLLSRPVATRAYAMAALDVRRDKAAALAVVEEIARAPVRMEQLRVRIGIATGLVIVGEPIGTGDARQQTAVGENPNLAARLPNLAGPNSIVIYAVTHRQIGGLFGCRDLEASVLKGCRIRCRPGRCWRELPSRAASRRCIAWVRETYATMQPFFAPARYVNYLGDDEVGEPVVTAYGPNYRRLQQVKAKYDPKNFFRMNQNIRPSTGCEDSVAS
jgi:class 3 adenylate cyclase